LTLVDPLGNAPGGVASDHTWTYARDKEDRLLIARTPPPQGVLQLVSESRYDAVGNRTVAIDASGQVTKYLYDERDSLAEAQRANAWTDPAMCRARCIGRRMRTTTPATYACDAGDRRRGQRAGDRLYL
jgi:YD repeat-containing protein